MDENKKNAIFGCIALIRICCDTILDIFKEEKLDEEKSEQKVEQ